MTFLQIVGRIMLALVNQPGVRDVLSQVGRYAVRQTTAALIRRVQQGTRPTRRGMPTIR